MSETSTNNEHDAKQTNIPETETTEIESDIFENENDITDVTDFSFSLEKRMNYLQHLFLSKGEEDTIEYINRLISGYENSKVKILEEYLLAICKHTSFSIFFKVMAIKSLCKISTKKSYDTLNELIYFEMPTPLKVELILLLMKSEEHRKNAIEFATVVVINQALEVKYRYKLLDVFNEKDVYFSFFYSETNIKYKILCSQWLLQNNTTEYTDFVERILLNMSLNKDIEPNIRSDCADVLILLGSNQSKNQAIMVINALGGESRTHIYDNSQNIHSKHISESTLKGIEFLSNFTPSQKTMNFLKDCIYITPKIQEAIERIESDRILFNGIYTLKDIFLRLWEYISNHGQKNELITRLTQELEDMASWCSSGYASRIVNTMSGFGDFSLTIGLEEQMYSYFKLEMEKYIKNLEDSEKDLILNELSESQEIKPNLLKFYRKYLIDIRNCLHNKFLQDVSEDDFELYFRNSLVKFESS